MKKIFSKILTGVVTLSMLAGLACHASETPEVTSFSDVPSTYWGYETIMDMTEYGIFKGTSTPVNGVGTFSPEKTMTRAEFITAALRAVYPEVAADIEMDKDQWWRGYYVLALDKGLLKVFELDDGDLSQPMSREEMAMVMVRCVENMGEKLEKRVSTSQIADYETIGSYYGEYVRDCFSYGLLCGVDTKGTFAPTKTLTRAEAATVLCRLIDKDMRINVELVEEPVDDDNRWDSYDETEELERDDGIDEQEELPWEKAGAKQPSEYTWEEYHCLTAEMKVAFANTFESYEMFELWMENAMQQWQDQFIPDNENNDETITTEKYPWENGGKKPSEYSWEEFQALDEYDQEAFFEWFDSAEDFEDWQNQAQGNTIDTTGKYPWENGGKKPSEYSWEEFQALDEYDQEAFFEWFDSAEDFEDWMNNVT